MANEKRLIDANALKAEIVDFKVNLQPKNQDYGTGYFSALSVVEGMLAYAPTVDAVSKGLFDQIKWERDIAIEQLADYGISLGEKADVTKVVHGRWIVKEHSAPYGGYHLFHCSECDEPNAREKNYCPNCGADMRGNEE